MTDYQKSLAREYLMWVNFTESGALDTDALLLANSERSIIHNQLLQSLGETRETIPDMVKWIRENMD